MNDLASLQTSSFPDTETYVYEKNRRFAVNQGTRCAMSEVKFNPQTSHHPSSYEGYADLAKRRARRAWEDRWGDIPWDQVQILMTYVTASVVVEFRVMEW